MAKHDCSKATLSLTKVAAAQRQLDAAIRMYFAEEDELAIHTVAAAAYRVLHDLNRKRGRRLLPNQALHYGMFHVARAFATGTECKLPESLRMYGETSKFVAGLSDFVRVHMSRTGKVPNFEDFIVEVPPSEWERFNRAANFLKHADRDFDKLLDLAGIDNLALLSNAMSAYICLMHDCTPAMRVFTAYASVLLEDSSGLDRAQVAIFDQLTNLDSTERRRACLVGLEALEEAR